MTNSQNKDKVDKIDELAKVINETIAKDEGIELTEEDIDVVKKANARLNIHIYIRQFLIILVKIAQKHAKENPQSELSGIGHLLIPMSKHIIDAIIEEIKADPDDLITLIEFFFTKLKADGFFIEETETDKEKKSND